MSADEVAVKDPLLRSTAPFTVAVSVADPTSGVNTIGPLKASELPVNAPGVKLAYVSANGTPPSDTVAWVCSKPWLSAPRS